VAQFTQLLLNSLQGVGHDLFRRLQAPSKEKGEPVEFSERVV
jgi:hypothetical protein